MDIELFSKDIEDKRFKREFFKNNLLKEAYLIGAYSVAIIDSSNNEKGKVVSKNSSFKKWLSNKTIDKRNLLIIFEKAYKYERMFQLDSVRNVDLRSLVTKFGSKVSKNDGKLTLKQELSFAFILGFDEYREFKKDNPYIENKNKENDSEK